MASILSPPQPHGFKTHGTTSYPTLKQPLTDTINTGVSKGIANMCAQHRGFAVRCCVWVGVFACARVCVDSFHIRTVWYPSTLATVSKWTRSSVDCSSQNDRSMVVLIVLHAGKLLAAKLSEQAELRLYVNGEQEAEDLLKTVDMMIKLHRLLIARYSMPGNVAGDQFRVGQHIRRERVNWWRANQMKLICCNEIYFWIENNVVVAVYSRNICFYALSPNRRNCDDFDLWLTFEPSGLVPWHIFFEQQRGKNQYTTTIYAH